MVCFVKLNVYPSICNVPKLSHLGHKVFHLSRSGNFRFTTTKNYPSLVILYTSFLRQPSERETHAICHHDDQIIFLDKKAIKGLSVGREILGLAFLAVLLFGICVAYDCIYDLLDNCLDRRHAQRHQHRQKTYGQMLE